MNGNGDGAEENAITALAFCAADETISWVPGLFDEYKKRAHKFLVLITDQWSRFHIDIPGS